MSGSIYYWEFLFKSLILVIRKQKEVDITWIQCATNKLHVEEIDEQQDEKGKSFDNGE